MNPLFKSFSHSLRPADRRPPWQWAEEHLYNEPTSPFKESKINTGRSPWIREPLECYSDNGIYRIAIQCSAQTSKTLLCFIGFLWAASEDPGPGMWVTSVREVRDKTVRDRIIPMIEASPTARSLLREDMNHAMKLGEINFTTMPLYVVTSGSEASLQSVPVRWLICDETRNYEPGALDLALKRTRTFWNSRELIVSTAGDVDDTMDQQYKHGDQRIWHFPCPHCGQYQPLEWKQMRWDTNEETKPSGKWNYQRVLETVRYECVNCSKPLHDKPHVREHICNAGKFVKTNPNAPAGHVSFHWNAMIAPWVDWADLVRDWLQAQEAARGGDIQPLKAFVNETLGEPWEDRLGEIDDASADIEMRCAEYDFGEPWAEESRRFMAVDKQAKGGEHYWWVIRAFGQWGRSRLVAYGRCQTYQELDEVRERFNVQPLDVVIDSGYKATEVYRICAAKGWKAFKGDTVESYIDHDPRLRKAIRRIWNKTQADPGIGTNQRLRPIPLFRWANDPTKDILADMICGMTGEWTLPRKVGRDYLRQMTAEKRMEKINAATGRRSFFWKRIKDDNHYMDCECMLIIAAVITKLIGEPEPKTGPAVASEG